MAGLLEAHEPGRGFFSAKNIVLGSLTAALLLLPAVPATRAVAAFTAFLGTFAVTAWLMSRRALEGVEVRRSHQARVFEEDRVEVKLDIRQRAVESGGFWTSPAQYMVLVEDTFPAAFGIYQRCLLPMLGPKWEIRTRYRKEAERHRGMYLMGPVRLWSADPLGVFFRRAAPDCVTRLTVYPRAAPLEGYRFLGPDPRQGPAMATSRRIGQGEEILSVRPYQHGDSMTRIHWRTSTRRGELHTMQLDSQVQTEVAIFLDLTRPGRYGTGVESTTETAIRCATSILTEAAAIRHRISMTWVRKSVETFEPGTGLAHLHLLLDRLAMTTYEGELDFWSAVGPRAAMLDPGSRAILITPAIRTASREEKGVRSPEETAPDPFSLVMGLTMRGVAVDVVLLDESELTRIWRDQDPSHARAGERLHELSEELRRCGARVLVLRRGQTAGDLMPRAGEKEDREAIRV